MIAAVSTGAVAGIGMGYVLQRGQLCFHSAITGAMNGRPALARSWALGVALASVGLAVLLLLPGTGDLNTGLVFRPASNILGGLIIGAGMAVAGSCVSGLFHKLGSGMLGASVGLAGWAVGELIAKNVTVPGPVVLHGGDPATIPGVLGLPRLPVAIALAVVVILGVRQRSASGPSGPSVPNGRWGTWKLGLGLGAAITGGWALAASGDSPFGPSSVGAVASVAASTPNYWLIAFLLGLIAGGTLGALTSGGLWIRGEGPVRYARLLLGGVLLGAGGWIAGGCNLGHGLSGAAQLNVSSFVVVAAMVTGLAATRSILPWSRTAEPVAR